MVAVSNMRMMFAVTLIVAVILGIVTISIDPVVKNARTDKERAYISFNIIGTIFVLGALLMKFLLIFLCGDRYKLMMLSIITLTGLGMVSFAVSVGVYSSITALPVSAWMLSALWTCVIACIIAVVFLFSDPESI